MYKYTIQERSAISHQLSAQDRIKNRMRASEPRYPLGRYVEKNAPLPHRPNGTFRNEVECFVRDQSPSPCVFRALRDDSKFRNSLAN